MYVSAGKTLNHENTVIRVDPTQKQYERMVIINNGNSSRPNPLSGSKL